MVEAFGGRTIRGEPIHGKDAEVEHDGSGLFEGLPNPLRAGRYHSLIADPELPGCARAHGHLRRRGDGRAPPRAARAWSPVPPRVGADARRQSSCSPTSSRCLTTILTRAIDEVAAGGHLTADHASAVLDEVMEGRSSEVQTAAFLIALRAKGETVAELVGLARTMRRLAAAVETSRDDLVDTAGTGGGPSTFNISTAAALVAAGAGCAVAKHGNRSNTSRCGSADLLEALGVRIELDPDARRRAASRRSASASCSPPATTPR